MVLNGSDIVFYKSGVSGDGLGGQRHIETVSPFMLHNVFNLVSGVERTVGKTKYRCVYMRNKHPTETGINPRLFIPKDTVSSTTTLYVGFDHEAGVGDGISSGVAQSIANEATAPTDVVFTNATDASRGIPLGIDLPPNKTVAIWFKLVIFLNTEQAKVDGCEVKVRFGNLIPQVGTGTTTDGIIAITGETDSLTPFANTIGRIKLRSGVNSVVFTGNVTSSTSVSTWINMLGTYKDRTAIAFGPLDAQNATMKNELITATNSTQNVKSLGFSFQVINNLYMIIMDVTRPFTNPSEQYDFVRTQLATAKAMAGIDFIMVVCNKSFYMTLASNDAALTIDNTLRQLYHKLFVDNGVHVVVCGQTRNYQRQHVIGYNSAALDTPPLYFTTEQPSYTIPAGQKNFGNTGCLFISIGTGGRSPLHAPITPNKAYTVVANGLTTPTSIGYMMVKSVRRTATRGPTLLGVFYEFYTPTGATTPVEVQRDHWAITIS
jgi:hypothetical protein